MRYKTLFRLALKVLGVWLLVQVVIQLPGMLRLVVEFDTVSGLGTTDWWLGVTLTQVAIQLALGLYLFFGGRWIADLAIPGNRPYCPECGYELIANTAESCPECGTVVATRAAEPPSPA